MRIFEQLRNVARHLEMTRGAGHTLTMLNGAKHTSNAIILCHTIAYGESLKEQNAVRNTATTPEMLGNLVGFSPRPLALDNQAVLQLMNDAVREIERLEHEVSRLLDH
jgi:hypothetical protein